MTTESWDGNNERRCFLRPTRRQDDWLDTEGGFTTLMAGVGLGAASTTFWAFVIWALRGFQG